jgi:branched-chain amino acid transport system substrate-binding protein
MRRFASIVCALAAAAAVGLLAPAGAQAQQKQVIIGGMCDRTGPTQVNGIAICPGIADYYDLVNSKGGIEGYKIKYMEIDHEYKVPPAVEAYEREKLDGATSIMVYGTPQVQALNQKLTEDKIPGTSPGFGIAASADGKRFPYLFPVAATYWSQGAAAVQFVKERLGGNLKGKKIAYLFYDNPAGREPIPVIEDLQKIEGFELRTFAVPPPAVEMGAQALDITQRYHPDFVIAHLFGRAPSVALKEFKRTGFPLSKVVGLVWAGAEHDVVGAGGWPVAEGYYTMSFAGVGNDYPVIRDIRAMYKAQGREPPKVMAEDSVMYNRGILWAALHVEATRNAIKLTGGKPPTGEDVKKGFEQIQEFGLGGLVPPLKVTAADHEGGGWVQFFQVKGGKFVKVSDWSRAYPEVVQAAIKKAE